MSRRGISLLQVVIVAADQSMLYSLAFPGIASENVLQISIEGSATEGDGQVSVAMQIQTHVRA